MDPISNVWLLYLKDIKPILLCILYIYLLCVYSTINTSKYYLYLKINVEVVCLSEIGFNVLVQIFNKCKRITAFIIDETVIQ